MFWYGWIGLVGWMGPGLGKKYGRMENVGWTVGPGNNRIFKS